MPTLTNISYIRDVLGRNGFRFSKSLGQNFLVNPSVCPRMAESSGITDKVGVLEIGPGIGVLTQELAKRARKVVSVEIDDRLLPVLAETLAGYDNVEIVSGDIMKLDVAALLLEKFAVTDEHGNVSMMPVVVCANLPYYITSPILMMLLESRLPVRSITVLVQKEAAERLCAEPGSRAGGAVTLAVNYYATAERLFDVSRGSFMPAPNVDSTVIRLDIRQEPACEVVNEKLLFRVIRSAFGQRRKTLANSLSVLGLPKPALISAIEECGLSPTVRAEQLTLAQFALLAARLEPLF